MTHGGPRRLTSRSRAALARRLGLSLNSANRLTTDWQYRIPIPSVAHSQLTTSSRAAILSERRTARPVKTP